MHSNGPRLFVVATPLGNLGDIAPRAREVLASADLVLAEDTRRAGLLFQHLGLASPSFLSLHEHNETARIPEVLTHLEEGATIALVSDAGTPLIADPGYRLVRACREAGYQVSPVPGPSAVATALSASGLPPYPYVFLGFLPRSSGERRRTLEPYAGLKATLVFFERLSRLPATLEDVQAVLGEREACVARELTKLHEEFILFRLGDWSDPEGTLKGEATVLIGPPEVREASAKEVDGIIVEERALGGGTKEVARRVHARVEGWTVKEIYERIGRR
ncbi:16S rRNA (cytidine(1402)-2'-O)-methyltransferase [Oceanidesulfovibrio marinus]|uniref:Ribosomal RNA small subunit methyltransferase I n=1 Tax=Oceanidesulfovibrio marinus TaxID=370038 RepID=A0ABX6NFY6_9BACT|nr:16S rRNA (cytidine(1402)-2'-O)-methyltransferase [Oceanidesulfovibrio marinus]QJT09201.1 16S rRNA (cytidine(1402)-2'-O)-methyltransferase [Oceanidesulfovibrio marinus]